MLGLILLGLIAAAVWMVIGGVWLAQAIMHPRRKTMAVALARGEPTDPGELNLQAQAVTWSLTHRVQSPGWIIRGNQPDLPVMIVIHGHRNSRYGSLRRAAALVDHASQVVVFDLPAHGDAFQNPGGDGPTAGGGGGWCTLGAREHEDVLCVMEQLGARRVVLFGSSMGAGIALATAWRSERVVGVIAEAPFRFWHLPARRTMGFKRYPSLFVPLAGLVLRLRGVRIGFDRAEDAAKLRCPLLLMHGRGDPVCPFFSTPQIAVAAPRVWIVAFEVRAHGDLSGVDERAYRAALRAFVGPLAQPVQ